MRAASMLSTIGLVSTSLSSKAQPVTALRNLANSVLPEPANPATRMRLRPPEVGERHLL